jgi:DNA repair protein RadA/Sms
VVSAIRDQPLPADLAGFGEVGLGGELRQVGQAQRRFTEAARLGLRRVVAPSNSPDCDADIEVIRAATLSEAIAAAGLGVHSAPSGLRPAG